MKNLKFLITLVVVISLICLSVYLWLSLNEAKQETDDIKRARKVITENIAVDAEIIAQKIDRDSLRHATILANENVYTPADLKNTESILDTTALAIGILKNQIIDLTKISTTIKAENLAAQVRIDSLNRRVYFYQDKFLKLSYRPAVDTVDKGEFDFAYDADLTVTQYSKRKHFLASKKYLIDIYSNDPRTTVNGVKRLSIEREVQPKFRLQSSMVYNTTFRTLTPGLIGRFEVKRFSLSGSYMYSPVRDRWFTAIGFNYDLIRF